MNVDDVNVYRLDKLEDLWDLFEEIKNLDLSIFLAFLSF